MYGTTRYSLFSPTDSNSSLNNDSLDESSAYDEERQPLVQSSCVQVNNKFPIMLISSSLVLISLILGVAVVHRNHLGNEISPTHFLKKVDYDTVEEVSPKSYTTAFDFCELNFDFQSGIRTPSSSKLPMSAP